MDTISWAWKKLEKYGAWIWNGAKWIYTEVNEEYQKAREAGYEVFQETTGDIIGEVISSLIPPLIDPILRKITDPIQSLISSIVSKLANLGIQPPEILLNWMDYIADAPAKILEKITGLKQLARSTDIQSAAGDEYVKRSISSQFIHDAIQRTTTYSPLMESEYKQYVTELHENHVDVPPVLPPNMPNIPSIIFTPPGHPFGLDSLGIPKIGESIEEVIHGVLESISHIKDAIVAVFNWILNTLQASINTIITGISNIGQWIAEGFTKIMQTIWDSIQEGASWLVDGIYNVWNSVTGWIQAIVQWVWGIISETYTWIWNAIVQAGQYIYGLFAQSFAWLQAGISDLTSNIVAGYNAIISFLDYLIQQNIRTITVDIPNLFHSIVGKITATIMSAPKVLEAVLTKGFDIMTDILRLLLDGVLAVSNTLTQIPLAFWGFVFDYAKETAIPMLQEKFQPEFDKIRELAISTYDGISEYIHSFAPITIEKVPELAASILGSTIGFGLLAHGISVGTELLHPLKNMGVHYLAGFMGDMGSFGYIASAVSGTLIATSIRGPYQSYLNTIFRPEKPDEFSLRIMRMKREITQPQYERFMAMHGYRDEIIQSQLNVIWRDPRIFEMIRVAEFATQEEDMPEDQADILARADVIPEVSNNWWYDAKFTQLGFSDSDLKIFSSAFGRIVKKPEILLFLARIRELYREGLMTEDEARKNLEFAGLRPDVVESRMQGLKLEYTKLRALDVKANAVFQYRNDLITDEQFFDLLDGAGYSPDRISIIFNTEKLRKQPKLAQVEKKENQKAVAEMQKLYKGYYQENFRNGLISADTYQFNLEAIGVTKEMASVIVSLEASRMYISPDEEKQKEAEKLITQVLREKITYYKLLFRALMITKTQLVAYLVAARVQVQLAIAIANTEEARMFSPPKEEPST